jgi:hypothetical protein
VVEDSNQPERPKAEPEIIPPDRRSTSPHRGGETGRWPAYSNMSQTHRVYVGRVGPIGIALLLLVVGVVIAALLLVIVGAVLLWIPVLILLVAAGALFRLLRR